MFGGVHVWMELLGIGLDQRWLLEIGILVQVAEPDPVVERNSTCTEEERK